MHRFLTAALASAVLASPWLPAQGETAQDESLPALARVAVLQHGDRDEAQASTEDQDRRVRTAGKSSSNPTVNT